MEPWILQTKRWLEPRRAIRLSQSAESTLDRLVRADATDDPSASELSAALAFVIGLGRALLSFGLPAQRLEDALGRLALALGFELDCFSTPTALIITMSGSDRYETRVVRVEPGDTDLERLSALHALVGRVERRELSPTDACRRVNAILAGPPRYGSGVVVASVGLAASASSILLGGGIVDLLPAFALGAFVGFLTQLGKKVRPLGRIVPGLAAVLLTLLARSCGLLGIEVHEPILVLAAVIVLLPGFTLTVATLELATGNVVSGTSRLVGAFATLVQLGFGVALGHRLAELLPPTPSAPPDNPEWLVWGAYAAVALAFGLLLQAAPRDIPFILVAAALSVAGARLGYLWLGPEIGAFVGAIVIGLVSHVFARVNDRPVLLLLTPGMLMLVPGSVGFLSVSEMLDSDTVGALETTFRMLLIATSLAAGVLVAAVAVPPRHAL